MELVDELIDIYLDGQQEGMRHILNRQTGEILFDAPDFTGEPEVDMDDEDSEFLIEVPTSSSSEMYKVMEDFAAKQSGDLSRVLLNVLIMEKPFRRFKDKLIELGIVDEWYEFERSYAKGRVELWLGRLGNGFEN